MKNPKRYYILCLSRDARGMALWWRPNNAGYTDKLEDAGTYRAEEVAKSPEYYNNGVTTQAIECEAVVSASWSVVYSNIARNLSPFFFKS